MKQKELAYLIKQYKSGKATPLEISRLETFWRDAGSNISFDHAHTRAELQDMEGRMFRKIKFEIGYQERPVSISRRPSPLIYYRVAAVLLVLISVTLWFFAGRNGMTEVRTGFGQRLTVTLPDQSSVALNGNSVLRYAGSWDDKTIREVWIEGEGFFSVTHTQNHLKFIVHADQLNVEVLGTKFNVKARNYVSEVMLAEGKVRLALAENAESEAVFLKPGEVATVADKRLSKRAAKEQQFTSWLQNKLFFENTPLSELALLLKETYGLQVKFKNPELAKRELSGEISSATGDDILLAIAETFRLKIEKEGQSVLFSETEK